MLKNYTFFIGYPMQLSPKKTPSSLKFSTINSKNFNPEKKDEVNLLSNELEQLKNKYALVYITMVLQLIVVIILAYVLIKQMQYINLLSLQLKECQDCIANTETFLYNIEERLRLKRAIIETNPDLAITELGPEAANIIYNDKFISSTIAFVSAVILTTLLVAALRPQ